MEIAILAFDGMTALDAVGPAQVLVFVPGARVRWVSTEPGAKRTDAGMSVVASASLSDVPHPDIVLVPGGLDMRPVMGDTLVLDWLRAALATTRWSSYVLTGGLFFCDD
jgi:putative intracellular protease/amidase